MINYKVENIIDRNLEKIELKKIINKKIANIIANHENF